MTDFYSSPSSWRPFTGWAPAPAPAEPRPWPVFLFVLTFPDTSSGGILDVRLHRACTQTSTCGRFLRSARLTFTLLLHQLAKFVWRRSIRTIRGSKTLVSFAACTFYISPVPNHKNRERINVGVTGWATSSFRLNSSVGRFHSVGDGV